MRTFKDNEAGAPRSRYCNMITRWIHYGMMFVVNCGEPMS